MQAADKGQAAPLDGTDLRIGIVQARFNEKITGQLARACLDELNSLGVAAKHITHVTVPGALEVPIALQAMADSERFDALVALGCIIRGETYHFELVSNESGAGVSRVSLDHQIAIANAVLTVETEAQAWERVDEKGRDAARVAIEMTHLLDHLS
jgi:6,7-dimethyl-8-ribityllumazine synthase